MTINSLTLNAYYKENVEGLKAIKTVEHFISNVENSFQGI